MIKEDWLEYYNFLEGVRRTGHINMYEASIYLVEAYQIDIKLADEVLLNWMDNYKELSEKFNWRN